MFCGYSSHVSSTKEDRISPLWNDQGCTPPFSCFSTCTMIDTATRRRYNTTMLQDGITRQRYKALLRYETSVLVTGGESSTCQLTQRRHRRGWTSHLIPFPSRRAASHSSYRSSEQRERQDRLFRPTGKTPLVLLPSMPLSLHYGYTMSHRRRQALNFLEKGKCSTFLRKERIWR
jgi:hypothetical protein